MNMMRASPPAGLLAGLTLLALLVPLLWLDSRLHAARALEQAGSETPSTPEAPQPGSGSLWEQLGVAALQAGQAPQAVLRLQRAAAVGSLSSSGQAALLDAHLALSDYPAAIEDLRRLLSARPGDARRLYQLGLLLAAQRPESALAYLDQAASLDASLKPQVEALRRGIITARVAGDPAYSLLTSGQALAQIEEWELAAEAFRQATLLRPDYAEAWAFLGEARQHLPSGSAAAAQGLAALQTALEIDPGSLSANTLLAVYWRRQEEFGKALQAIQSAIRLDPSNPVLRAEAGSLLGIQGDLAAGLESYQQAVSLAPADPEYLRLLAGFGLQYKYEVLEVALPAARQALALAPQDPANLDLMAQVMLALDDRVSAGRFLQRALQAGGNTPSVHLHLGQLHLANGDMAAAKDELALAISLEPQGPAAGHARRLMQSYFP